MIWLIGNKGMLGTEFSLLLEKSDLPFTGTDREIDIGNSAALENFAAAQPTKIEWVINCAAYTAVDKAEDDEAACRLLNVTGAANIARTAKKIGAGFIHLSTDYVFDGKGSRPYTEEDTTSPTGVYGLTKRDGENAVMRENPASYIIRTAWLYGRHGNNFVNTMLKLMKERESISVVMDQTGSPTWAFDLSKAIVSLVRKNEAGKIIPAGIYHFTNEGICSWFDFAQAIYNEAKALGLLPKPCEVKSCTSAEYPAKVKRPAYSVLDKTKIKNNLDIKIPEWKTSLKQYLESQAEQN